MTDDAELRARIEAQVAARRAGGSSSRNDRDAGDEQGAEPSGSAAAARGSSPLAPIRPWSRTRTPPVPPPAQQTPPGDRPSGPIRPWLRRGTDATERPAAPPPEPRGAGATSPTGLTPARPWHRGADAGGADDQAAPASPAPSNPEIVLQGLTGDLETPTDTEAARGRPGRSHAVPKAPTGRRRRLTGRPDEPAPDVEPAAEVAPAAGSPLPDSAAEPAPAAYVPDEATVTAYVDAAAPMLDEPDAAAAEEPDAPKGARRRRRSAEPDASNQPRHAAPPQIVQAPAAEAGPATPADPLDPPTAATEPPSAPVADAAAAEQTYPWQRRAETDLDLHGAPTWDPGQYEEEPAGAETRRGRRAMRWLLARAPEPESEPGVPAAEPGVPAAEPGVLAAEPVASKRPLVSRLFGRGGDDGAGGEDPEEEFALPEPDASFERPWLRAPGPAPTRQWSPRPPTAPAPVTADEPEQPPEPGPPVEPAPVPQPERRPTPGLRPRPSPGTPPPSAPEPPPRPRPASGAPPAPRPDSEAESPAAGPPAAPPTSSTARAPLGISGSTPSDQSAAQVAPATGISGASGWGTTNAPGRSHAPDISKFLEATSPERQDDKGEAGPDGPTVTGRTRRWLVRTLVIVVIAAIAAMLLRAFVVQPFYIPSASMEPTLHGCGGCNDDHVLVDKISYRAHDVRAGDIVVFHRPPQAGGITEKVLIKRVIALPGDVVELKKGRVFVNGLVLDEPYLNTQCGPNPTVPLTGTSKWKVPGNDVFVMGDNRCRSEDSRQFGPIAESSIIGRAFAIIWPFHRIGLL